MTNGFGASEVEALEQVVQVFRGWSSSTVSGLARSAVVGQLHELAGQLRQAPAGPRTDRAFVAGAELAKIAGSMSFDAGLQGAQRKLGDFYRETARWAAVPALGDARERLRPLLAV